MNHLALQVLYAAAVLGMRERSKASVSGDAAPYPRLAYHERLWRCVDEVEAAL